jgi:hypothetical protein
MPRANRFFVPEHVWHITHRCHEKEFLLNFARNNKSGYALSVQRGEEQINVPVQAEQFLYATEFLRHLSLQQAWVEEVERPAE